MPKPPNCRGKIPKNCLILNGCVFAPLFERAFIEGLHQPHLRPSADEWEHALVKTVDLMQPCSNTPCEQKWYVFSNSTKPVVHFVIRPLYGKLPVLNLYSSQQEGRFFTR
jgi:DNA-binding helix-hairpin-helix protein with protein kinase domain